MPSPETPLPPQIRPGSVLAYAIRRAEQEGTITTHPQTREVIFTGIEPPQPVAKWASKID